MRNYTLQVTPFPPLFGEKKSLNHKIKNCGKKSVNGRD